MKKRMIGLIMLISVLLAVVIGLFAVQESLLYRWSPPEQGAYETTIRVVADIDYEPISFIDKNGNYAGHDVELIYAIGEILGVNIDLELMEWSDAVACVQEGECDLLLSVAYSQQRTDWMEYSTPVMNEPYVVFGRDAKDFSIAELLGARIALMEGDAVKDAVITSYALEGTIYYLPTYEPCFEMLAAGECDYVIAPRTVGLGLMRDMGLDDIEVSDSAVYNSIYCIAAPEAGAELIGEVNRALYQLSMDGTLDEIYHYWMEEYIGAGNVLEVIEEYWMTLVVVALVILFGFCAILLFYENKRSRQLTLQMENEREINALTNQLDAVLRGISGGFSICRDDEEFSFIYVSEAVAALLGYTPEEFMQASGGTTLGVVYPEDISRVSNEQIRNLENGENFSLKYRMRCKDGTLKWVTDSGKLVINEKGEREFYCFYQDVTELEESRRKLKDLAYVDLLTGQGNKTAYMRKVSELEEQLAQQPEASFGIVVFDLNDLKRINDAIGHDMGDLYIKTAVRYMQEAFEGSTIYRIGGDEFVVLVLPPELEQIDQQAALFEEKLDEYNRLSDEFPSDISVALGWTKYDRGSDACVKDTFCRADALMYQNKRAKKTCSASGHS